MTECSGVKTTLHGAEGRKTKTPTGLITHGGVSLLRPLQRLRLGNGCPGLGLRHRHLGLGLGCCGASLGLRCRGASLGLSYSCTSLCVPARRIRLGQRRSSLRSGDPRIRKGLALPSGAVSAARSPGANKHGSEQQGRSVRRAAEKTCQVGSAPLSRGKQTWL